MHVFSSYNPYLLALVPSLKGASMEVWQSHIIETPWICSCMPSLIDLFLRICQDHPSALRDSAHRAHYHSTRRNKRMISIFGPETQVSFPPTVCFPPCLHLTENRFQPSSVYICVYAALVRWLHQPPTYMHKSNDSAPSILWQQSFLFSQLIRSIPLQLG